MLWVSCNIPEFGWVYSIMKRIRNMCMIPNLLHKTSATDCVPSKSISATYFADVMYLVP